MRYTLLLCTLSATCPSKGTPAERPECIRLTILANAWLLLDPACQPRECRGLDILRTCKSSQPVEDDGTAWSSAPAYVPLHGAEQHLHVPKKGPRAWRSEMSRCLRRALADQPNNARITRVSSAHVCCSLGNAPSENSKSCLLRFARRMYEPTSSKMFSHCCEPVPAKTQQGSHLLWKRGVVNEGLFCAPPLNNPVLGKPAPKDTSKDTASIQAVATELVLTKGHSVGAICVVDLCWTSGPPAPSQAERLPHREVQEDIFLEAGRRCLEKL